MPQADCYQSLLSCLAELDNSVLYPSYIGDVIANKINKSCSSHLSKAVEKFYQNALDGNEWKIFDEEVSSDEIGAYNIDEFKKSHILSIDDMEDLEAQSIEASKEIKKYMLNVLTANI